MGARAMLSRRLMPLLWLVACGGAEHPAHVGILAPRSLQPVLEPVVAGWELSHGIPVRIGFDPPDPVWARCEQFCGPCAQPVPAASRPAGCAPREARTQRSATLLSS